MDWLKVVVGFALIFGAVAAWYRILRNLKGDGGGGMKMDLPSRRKRSRGDAPNELEQFIASHRGPPTPAAPAAQPMARAPRPSDSPPVVSRPVVPVPVAAPPSASIPAPVVASAPAVAISPARRPLLEGAHKLVYGLFKSVLPEYTVFACIPLAQVVPGAGTTGHVLAVVVCRPDLSVVAAVDLVAAGAISPPVVAQTLAGAGIRHLAIDPRALPRREAVREFVHGA